MPHFDGTRVLLRTYTFTFSTRISWTAWRWAHGVRSGFLDFTLRELRLRIWTARLRQVSGEDEDTTNK